MCLTNIPEGVTRKRTYFGRKSLTDHDLCRHFICEPRLVTRKDFHVDKTVQY